jgi:hypothetical protein
VLHETHIPGEQERPVAGLARASYLLPWIALLLSFATRWAHRQGALASARLVTIHVPLLCLGIYLVGLVLGVYALRRVSKDAPARRTARKAVFFNAACLAAFTIGFIYAVLRATAHGS